LYNNQAEEGFAMGRCGCSGTVPEIEKKGKERGTGERLLLWSRSRAELLLSASPRRSRMVAPAIDNSHESRVASQLETFKRRIGQAIDRCMSGRGEHLKDEVDANQWHLINAADSHLGLQESSCHRGFDSRLDCEARHSQSAPFLVLTFFADS
jgi:hypothetical protein